MAGSTLRSRGTSRLGFTVTLGMVSAGRQLVRLWELKLGPGATQLLHPEVPGRGLPTGVTSQPLRLLKPTTQERQAMVAPPAWEQEGPGMSKWALERWWWLPPVAARAGWGLRHKHLLYSAH
jgi:hypothetical protein